MSDNGVSTVVDNSKESNAEQHIERTDSNNVSVDASTQEKSQHLGETNDVNKVDAVIVSAHNKNSNSKDRGKSTSQTLMYRGVGYHMVNWAIANAPCTGNPIDDCWRCNPDWDQNRQVLATCAIGFGKNAVGGQNGNFYEVTTPDDDPINPAPGTLRFGVIQVEPLWITFSQDMVINLKAELPVNSFKTIDGRGANVSIGDGPCLMVRQVNNVIIHGIHLHNCADDGVSIISSTNIWVDHCSLSKCFDGLIDVTHGSTAVTLSNNYLTNHDKVMLLGHDDTNIQDKVMQVTVAFNHFGEGLVERMPRCRYGYFHVVNNDYTRWLMYAIGGSAAPTIISQGNRFLASDNIFTKEVTKREGLEIEWRTWNWTSQGDTLLNGAQFLTSGTVAGTPKTVFSLVDSMTIGAGVLNCHIGGCCSP